MKNGKSSAQHLRLYIPPPEDVSTFKGSHYTIPRTPNLSQKPRVTIQTPQTTIPIANLANILYQDSMQIPYSQQVEEEQQDEEYEYQNQQLVLNSALFQSTGVPDTVNITHCRGGCGMQGHSIDECTYLRRNFSTGQIMSDFPLNPWKWSQLPEINREHSLLQLQLHGYFSMNGTDEDFKLFCKQVEINAQSLARDREERHQNWIKTHPEEHRNQEMIRSTRGRGYRGRGRGRTSQYPYQPPTPISQGRGDVRQQSQNTNRPTVVVVPEGAPPAATSN